MGAESNHSGALEKPPDYSTTSVGNGGSSSEVEGRDGNSTSLNEKIERALGENKSNSLCISLELEDSSPANTLEEVQETCDEASPRIAAMLREEAEKDIDKAYVSRPGDLKRGTLVYGFNGDRQIVTGVCIREQTQKHQRKKYNLLCVSVE